MKRKETLKINIPEPCQQSWDNMTSDGCGRVCTSCQKTVIDFTVMTDAEIIDIFRRSATIPCGRFFPEQLDRPLQYAETIKPFPFYRKIAAAVLALQAFTVASFAQGKKKPAIAAQDKKPQQHSLVRTIKGKLIGDNNKPVPGMPLVLTANGYDKLYATTDEQGCFLFTLPENYQPEKIRLSLMSNYKEAQGFVVDETLELNQETLHTELTVYRFQPVLLPEAEVRTTAYDRRPYSGVIAVTTYSYRKPTIWQRISHPFKKYRRR